MKEVNHMLNRITQEYDNAVKHDTSAVYYHLSHVFHQGDDLLREHIQAKTADKITLIIEKLTWHESLSSTELEQVRGWLVGDADNYIAVETNYNDWELELKRIVEELHIIKDSPLSVVAVAKVRALAKDARRVVDDIVAYKEDLERIERFEKATKHIDTDESKLIAELLKGKMRSPDF